MAKNMTRRAFPRGGVRTRLPVTIYRRASDEFSPTEIEGLALWLDASASGSLFQDTSAATAATANPNPIGYWKDLSGNGKHATQGTANNRPVISPDLRNGRKVLRFDGLNSADADFLGFSNTAVQTIFGVCYVNTAAGNLSSLIANSSGSTDIRRHFDPSPSDRWRGLSNQNSDIGDFANPAGSQFRVNGVGTNLVAEQVWHLVTAIRGTGTAEINQTGRAQFPARSFGGDIAEFICYDRALTNSERDTVERELGKKWGLTIG